MFFKSPRLFFASRNFTSPTKTSTRIFLVGRQVAVCGILGYGISNYVLTDDRLEPVYEGVWTAYSKLAQAMERLGLEIPFAKAHAFSTADHGLHPPHYPWEHAKWWKTFDHSS